ncbi:hypothetical protein HOE67_00420 [Candidatus Peregrinibacteria bacterium]|jgi:hypothetical protein|nr:hypothetical protein [Candidatus Peregrinibacteria bacterium]MBT4055556.1 hypothetical protein [Candidatus Peregrinibacteria bacterium]
MLGSLAVSVDECDGVSEVASEPLVMSPARSLGMVRDFSAIIANKVGREVVIGLDDDAQFLDYERYMDEKHGDQKWTFSENRHLQFRQEDGREGGRGAAIRSCSAEILADAWRSFYREGCTEGLRMMGGPRIFGHDLGSEAEMGEYVEKWLGRRPDLTTNFRFGTEESEIGPDGEARSVLGDERAFQIVEVVNKAVSVLQEHDSAGVVRFFSKPRMVQRTGRFEKDNPVPVRTLDNPSAPLLFREGDKASDIMDLVMRACEKCGWNLGISDSKTYCINYIKGNFYRILKVLGVEG